MTIANDNNECAARQVTVALRQLESLSVLPETLGCLLGSLDSGGEVSFAKQIIAADPGLTAAFLSKGYCSADQDVDSMSVAEIKSVALSVPVVVPSPADDVFGLDVVSYKQMVLHSVATACAAKQIAELTLPESERQLAYTAGLLHDIGKLAIEQVMPKSFQRIASLSQANHSSFHVEELANLGTNHTIIGKKLGEKWQFPKLVIQSIWLHHTQTQNILQDKSTDRFISVIRLADIAARMASIGCSGSFDVLCVDPALLSFLNLSISQVDGIVDKLSGFVDEKRRLLGLDSVDPELELMQMLQESAAGFAGQTAELEIENRRLLAASLQTDMIQQLVSEFPGCLLPIDLAGTSVSLWQKHYQCGAAALYFVSDNDSKMLEMAAVDGMGQLTTNVTKLQMGRGVVPETIENGFDVIDAFETSSWVLNQAGIDCDISKIRMLPLMYAGKAFGALVFEQGANALTLEQQKEIFEVPAGVIASMLNGSLVCSSNSTLAERFVTMLSQDFDHTEDASEYGTFEAIAEMAAGAAHELNNPLAIISGRTQLLADAETDPEKKAALEQIQKRAEEASRMVTQLMTFAKPQSPKFSHVSVRKIVEGAAELVAVAKRIIEPEISFVGFDGLGQVNVDGDHLVAAVTAIISNAMESYELGCGVVQLTTDCPQKPGMAAFLVKDHGRGMDGEKVAKATTPFFSSLPAGRKRGMGLANAHRLITLNKGLLKITSIPGKGTTVRVDLPLA